MKNIVNIVCYSVTADLDLDNTKNDDVNCNDDINKDNNVNNNSNDKALVSEGSSVCSSCFDLLVQNNKNLRTKGDAVWQNLCKLATCPKNGCCQNKNFCSCDFDCRCAASRGTTTTTTTKTTTTTTTRAAVVTVASLLDFGVKRVGCLSDWLLDWFAAVGVVVAAVVAVVAAVVAAAVVVAVLAVIPAVAFVAAVVG